MPMSYLKLFHSFREEIELLTMEERGRLLTAMLDYSATGRLPGNELTGSERILFPVCKQRIDRDAESYEKQVEAGRANGWKGGRPSKTPRVFSKPLAPQDKDKGEEEDQEKEKDEEKDEEKEKVRVRASGDATPTLREVLEQCKKEAPSVDGERFWNYYEANGWRTAGRRIRNWKAKLREWERGNRTGNGPGIGIAPGMGISSGVGASSGMSSASGASSVSGLSSGPGCSAGSGPGLSSASGLSSGPPQRSGPGLSSASGLSSGPPQRSGPGLSSASGLSSGMGLRSGPGPLRPDTPNFALNYIQRDYRKQDDDRFFLDLNHCGESREK